MSKRAVVTALGCVIAGLAGPGVASAEGWNPYASVPSPGPIEVDMAELVQAPRVAEPVIQPDLSRLGAEPQTQATPGPGQLPAGWVQIGEVVQREEVAMGFAAVAPEPPAAWEDIEGNQYPRKHTLFLNFNGATLYGGEDNSAENKSSLAKPGHKYPQFGGAESSALAIVQAVQEDMASFGVVIQYAKRPSKTLPYTMAMVGGQWQDTNIGDPAGGVAPGTDCEARGQRHVVYAFDTSSATVGQEAAHAWGLDHTMGADRIMSYQPGNNKHFGDNCQDLCEEACQGKGTIGCRLIHEKYCGVGSEQQNDLAELGFIFGTNEPDTEAPEVSIVSPEGDVELAVGDDLAIAGFVHDNYGGVGWKLIVKKDGAVVFDEVDYEKKLAWNFSNTPQGVYEVTLEAEDHFGHVVQDVVIVTVGDPPQSSGSAEGTGSAEGGSSGSAEVTGDVPTGDFQTSGGGEASGSSETGVDVDDGGGCRISGGAGGPAGLVAPVFGLGLAWRARRRRSAAV